MNRVNNAEITTESINEQRPRIDGEQQDATQALAVDAAQRQVLPQPNQFGAVRDRLFHAMLVRVAINYNRHVPVLGKRFIEFSSLLMAIVLLSLMFYVHHFFDETDSNCLAPFMDQWPRNGVLRVEVIRNLKKFNAYQDRLLEKSYARQNNENNITVYDLKRILMEGPEAFPKELRSRPKHYFRKKSDHWSSFLTSEDSLLSLFIRSDNNVKKKLFMEDLDNDEFGLGSHDFTDDSDATFEYVVEYSLYYGLLKLPHSYRLEHNIPFLLVRLDPDVDSCFGDWISRTLMKNFIGYEDVLMSSVKALAENETDKGYLRDMITGEHYRFVTMGNPRASYFTALIVMLIFTFAISMLLRFSHHQIFLFIVDLLQMFELNQSLVFPAAPLLTVILALVGMEAIMSEVFNDTSTAFYVILLVWIADQYDAICCHSPISKRHWLRFFYLYHYAFYAYQYRYNGQYGGLALLTSSFFILHSMIFFFHHYEMPLIIYHDRLQRIITDLQHNPQQNTATGTSSDAQTATNVPTNAASADSLTENVGVESSADGSLSSGEASSSTNGSTTSDIWSSEAEMVLSVPNKLQGVTELGEGSSSMNEISNNLTLSDPLLMAGEQTAHEIVDSAIDCVFNSTITTEETNIHPL
uniref:Membralin n=1 Tax=Onchocerca volvulus TaxID=6282 RepID=A0A8R1TJI2_ONCVO